MQTDNRINYIEFCAPDLEKIKVFYTTAFGWTFTDYGPQYCAFNDGSLDGGFERGEVRGDGALVILYAQNLEDAVKRVEAAGGTVTKPIYAFPGGRRFHFRDPAGNELAIWSEA